MIDNLFSGSAKTKKAPTPRDLPDAQRAAFYGAFFAMAAADETIDQEEMELIFETLDLEGMGEGSKREVYGYIYDPPDFDDCIEAMRGADEVLRSALMLNLVEIAVADDLEADGEMAALRHAQKKLGVKDEQLDEMKKFAYEARRIRQRGIDDARAADALKRAAAGLTRTSVPIEAVGYSGSVASLTASGFSVLGFMGLGMLPIIGLPVALAAGIYMGANRLLNPDQESKKEKMRAERQRKAQLAVRNQQEAINQLIDRMAEMQQHAGEAEANREAVRALNERMRKLKKLLNRREKDLQEA